MTRRWERPLLIFSLALNVAFVSVAAVRLASPDRPATLSPRERRHAAMAERWQSRRIAMLSRRLDLDTEQRQRLVSNLRPFETPLRRARQDLEAERRRFEAALGSGDAPATQRAAAAVSRAQVHLDSLSAEAMLREIEVLHPEQRQHYLRWTFRPGPRHGRRMGPPPGGR